MNHPDRSFFRLPAFPIAIKPGTESLIKRVEAFYAKKFLHNEMMRRIGKGGQTQKKERIYSIHPIEIINKSISITRNNKVTTQQFEFKVVTATGNAPS